MPLPVKWRIQGLRGGRVPCIGMGILDYREVYHQSSTKAYMHCSMTSRYLALYLGSYHGICNMSFQIEVFCGTHHSLFFHCKCSYSGVMLFVDFGAPMLYGLFIFNFHLSKLKLNLIFIYLVS